MFIFLRTYDIIALVTDFSKWLRREKNQLRTDYRDFYSKIDQWDTESTDNKLEINAADNTVIVKYLEKVQIKPKIIFHMAFMKEIRTTW